MRKYLTKMYPMRVFQPWFVIVQMDLDAEGRGPEMNPEKVVCTDYEIWDSTCQTVYSNKSLKETYMALAELHVLISTLQNVPFG